MAIFSPGLASEEGSSPKRLKTSDSATSLCAFVDSGQSENVEDDESSSEAKTIRVVIDTDVLDCSICMERLSAPVYQCSNGHIACSSCCMQMNNRCHSCSRTIGHIRCLAIEKLLESMKVPCKFASNGCKQLVQYSQMASHEETCAYVPYKCPVTECEFSGSVKNFVGHLRSVHNARNIYFRKEAWFSVMLKINEPYCVLEGEDTVFLLHNEMKTYGNHVFATGVGPSQLQEHYTYQIEIKTGRGRLTMESIPQSIGKIHTNSKDYLVIPVDLYQEGGHFLFEISFHHRF